MSAADNHLRRRPPRPRTRELVPAKSWVVVRRPARHAAPGAEAAAGEPAPAQTADAAEPVLNATAPRVLSSPS